MAQAKSPPPDLPSLLLDARIVYLGMPLVSAVTELIIAELLYLQVIVECISTCINLPLALVPVPTRNSAT
jgi:ATP-dependent protease ClpP protease subunit